MTDTSHMSTRRIITSGATLREMPENRKVRPSPLALTVLGMLGGGPLHPYAIQRQMKAWGKDRVVNVSQRASLYRTIERLHHAGLVTVLQTERDQRFPERTVYELTDEGWREGRKWLADMLAAPRNEFPEFAAALSFVFGLPPTEVQTLLERRAAVIRENLAGLDRELAGRPGPQPPRVTMLDPEYLRAITAAELHWLDGVLDDLRSGALTWTLEEIAATSKAFLPSD
jgi:DNA-binding PadR family transcriptional regulator